jgi:predicted  nucleic acid-binding Zn-ribbon protein
VSKALLETLSEIQEEDLEIMSLQSEVEKLYSTMHGHKDEADKLSTQKEQLKQDIMERKARMNLDEVTFKELQDSVQSLKNHLKESKDLKEYHGLNSQIAAKATLMSGAEDEVLRAMEIVESRNKEVADLDTKIAEIDVKVKESEASVSGEVTELQKAISRHEKKRNKIAKDVDGDLLEEYNRLFKHYDGEAVCGVEDKTCEGCFMSLTANHQVLVTTGTEIVRCPSCNRILFAKPEVAEE